MCADDNTGTEYSDIGEFISLVIRSLTSIQTIGIKVYTPRILSQVLLPDKLCSLKIQNSREVHYFSKRVSTNTNLPVELTCG